MVLHCCLDSGGADSKRIQLAQVRRAHAVLDRDKMTSVPPALSLEKQLTDRCIEFHPPDKSYRLSQHVYL